MDGRDDMAGALEAVEADMAVAVEALHRALMQERAALDSADADALDLAGEAKVGHLRTLEGLDVERRQLLSALGDGETAANAQPAWRRIREKLAACHALNGTNGAIVSRRLSQVRGALAALTGAHESPSTYGPAGHQIASPLTASRARI
jgi:flagella synthesis protein FlgN